MTDSAASQTATTETGGTDAAEVKALATELFEILNRRDAEAMRAQWDEHSVDDFIVLGPVQGEHNLHALFTELFAAFPDWHMDVERLTAEGDTAVVQWRATGTFSGGEFQGIKPTGKPVDFRGVDVIQYIAGKIRHNDVYYDGLTFARQIGMLPPTDSPADKAMTAAFNGLTALKSRISR